MTASRVPTRILLFTGKGGTGTTTVAAASAAAIARRGRRTLLWSLRPDRSVADVLGASVGASPRSVAPRLDAAAGPELPDHVAPWEVVVVDGGPTTSFLPWLDQAWGNDPERMRAETLVARAAHAATSTLAPPISEMLRNPHRTTARIVTTDHSVVVAETRRALVALALLGCPVDVVLWRGRSSSAATLAIAGVPATREVPTKDPEPVGLTALHGLADDVWGADDPAASPTGRPPLRIGRIDDGYELILDLPFVERGELDLGRGRDHLVVQVGEYRRTLPLPDSLVRRRVRQATLRDGALRIHFADPVR